MSSLAEGLLVEQRALAGGPMAGLEHGGVVFIEGAAALVHGGVLLPGSGIIIITAWLIG
jgi:hypothetical protein